MHSEDLYTLDDFERVPKFDMHVHVNREGSVLVQLARECRFRLMSVATDGVSGYPTAAEQVRINAANLRENPDVFAYTTALTLDRWGESDWAAREIEALGRDIAQGAAAVKVWKNIGMEARGPDGNLIMMDDPRLDPVLQFIADQNSVLLSHSGEPRNCWLPLEEMTVRNDREYFRAHPEFHLHLHPEMPAYEHLNEVRDRSLARHPDLRFVGAHLASLEWSVESIGEFLDRFPRASVDLADRVSHVQYLSQRDRETVRNFFVTYQDRILYGTDTQELPQTDLRELTVRVRERWSRDWRYFTTDDAVSVPELDAPVQGLALPKAVVDKIYSANPERLFLRG